MSDLLLDPSRYFPAYQPIVDLVTGRVGGYEVLARYRDERGQLCSAGALFHRPDYPQEQVLNIDRQLRAQALAFFAAHPDAGYLTLNISPDRMNLALGNQSPTLAMIDAAGIDPARVVIEITEGRGSLAQIEQLVARYRAAGLRIAIDDFGAGASQVDRIVALKPDLIKLDMRLFKAAARGGLSADVTLAAAAIAERVGCDIVCEGVESPEELHFGIECGARYIQGFIFAPASPELLPAQSTLEQVRSLQGTFLERKTARLRTSASHNHRVCEAVLALRGLLLDGRTDAICAAELHQQGILRYYLCAADGTQITENFEVTAEGLVSQPQYQGCNWSHRPYFPLLLALEAAMARELVVSNGYRDTISRQLCKTYGTYLGHDRVLLVDVVVGDDVLYAPLT